MANSDRSRGSSYIPYPSPYGARDDSAFDTAGELVPAKDRGAAGRSAIFVILPFFDGFYGRFSDVVK